jgi:hypothetical protein
MLTEEKLDKIGARSEGLCAADIDPTLILFSSVDWFYLSGYMNWHSKRQ